MGFFVSTPIYRPDNASRDQRSSEMFELLTPFAEGSLSGARKPIDARKKTKVRVFTRRNDRIQRVPFGYEFRLILCQYENKLESKLLARNFL
jgi:hypothetical protein